MLHVSQLSSPNAGGGGNLFCHRHVDASWSGHITNSNPADEDTIAFTASLDLTFISNNGSLTVKGSGTATFSSSKGSGNDGNGEAIQGDQVFDNTGVTVPTSFTPTDIIAGLSTRVRVATCTFETTYSIPGHSGSYARTIDCYVAIATGGEIVVGVTAYGRQSNKSSTHDLERLNSSGVLVGGTEVE